MTAPAPRRRSWSSRLVLLFFLRSKHRVVHDVRVAVFEDAKNPGALDKVEAALDLVLHHDQRAIQVLRMHTDGIFVFGTHGGGYAEWGRGDKLVFFKPEYVSAPATSALHLAATLVHEATHAWLEKMGFQYSLEHRSRIEAICIKRSLRCAKYADAGNELISELEQQLTCNPEYYSNAAFRERAVTEVERLGIPRRYVIAGERWINRWRRLTRRLKAIPKGLL
jgi:hypothetical protein